MKSSQKMIERLRKLGMEISDKSEIRRTYSGRHQRASGAWSWFILDEVNPGYCIGGYNTIKRLVSCPRLECYSDHRFWGYNVECGCKLGEGCRRKTEMKEKQK